MKVTTKTATTDTATSMTLTSSVRITSKRGDTFIGIEELVSLTVPVEGGVEATRAKTRDRIQKILWDHIEDSTETAIKKTE